MGKVWGPKNDLTMATTMALSFVPKSGDFSPELSHHLPSRCGEIHWAFHGKQSVLCRLHFSIMISWRLQRFSWFQLATGHSPSLRTILGSLSASHSDTLDMGTLMQMAYFSTHVWPSQSHFFLTYSYPCSQADSAKVLADSGRPGVSSRSKESPR